MLRHHGSLLQAKLTTLLLAEGKAMEADGTKDGLYSRHILPSIDDTNQSLFSCSYIRPVDLHSLSFTRTLKRST